MATTGSETPPIADTMDVLYRSCAWRFHQTRQVVATHTASVVPGTRPDGLRLALQPHWPHRRCTTVSFRSRRLSNWAIR